MKSLWLLLLVCAPLNVSAVIAASPNSDTATTEAGSLAQQLKDNPDDVKLFAAWLNETFTGHLRDDGFVAGRC